MTASWATLFDRGTAYDVDLEDVRDAAADTATVTETESNPETEAGDDA